MPVALKRFVKHNRIMTIVNRQLAHKVWELSDLGNTVEEIWDFMDSQATTPEERLKVPSITTLGRITSIKDKFEEETSRKQINLHRSWRLKMVKQLRTWWKEYNRLKGTPTEPPSLKRHRHIDRLLELASRLRGRIVNPHLDEQFYADESVWYLGSQDWRLAPSVWLQVMTPDLKYWKQWKLLFADLEEYLTDIPVRKDYPNRSFHKDYNELEADVRNLEDEYKKTAQEISKYDSDFAIKWARLQDDLTDYALANCKPNRTSILLPEQIKPLPSQEFRKETLEKFAKLIPNLENRFRPIESKLQQLFDELDPDVIKPIIEQKSYKHCSKSIKDNTKSTKKIT